MSFKSLAQIRRRAPEELKGLLAASTHESVHAGQKLLAEAREYGIPVREFLQLAINPQASENPAQFAAGNGKLVGTAR